MRNRFMDVRDIINLPPQERSGYLEDVMDMEERVYLSLTGRLRPEYRLDWVENIDVPGHPFYEHYCEMRRACEQLQKRLGEDCPEEELEEILFSMRRRGEIAAMKMFQYGVKYQKMAESLEEAPFLTGM